MSRAVRELVDFLVARTNDERECMAIIAAATVAFLRTTDVPVDIYCDALKDHYKRMAGKEKPLPLKGSNEHGKETNQAKHQR